MSQPTPAAPVKPVQPAPVQQPASPGAAPQQDQLASLVASLQAQKQGGGTSESFQLPADLAAVIQTSLTGQAQQDEVPEAAASEKPLDLTVTSSSHRAAYMRLSRFMESAEGQTKYPHMSKMFAGTAAEACFSYCSDCILLDWG